MIILFYKKHFPIFISLMFSLIVYIINKVRLVCRHCVSTISPPGASFPFPYGMDLPHRGSQGEGLPPGEGCYQCDINNEGLPLEKPLNSEAFNLRHKRDVDNVSARHKHRDNDTLKVGCIYRLYYILYLPNATQVVVIFARHDSSSLPPLLPILLLLHLISHSRLCNINYGYFWLQRYLTEYFLLAA